MDKYGKFRPLLALIWPSSRQQFTPNEITKLRIIDWSLQSVWNKEMQKMMKVNYSQPERDLLCMCLLISWLNDHYGTPFISAGESLGPGIHPHWWRVSHSGHLTNLSANTCTTDHAQADCNSPSSFSAFLYSKLIAMISLLFAIL